MPTDPKRIKVTDKGNPQVCSVWAMHKIYANQSYTDSDNNEQNIYEACVSAKISCVECKKCLINSISKQQEVWLDKAQAYPVTLLKEILHEGKNKAASLAKKNMEEIKQAMGLIV